MGACPQRRWRDVFLFLCLSTRWLISAGSFRHNFCLPLSESKSWLLCARTSSILCGVCNLTVSTKSNHVRRHPCVVFKTINVKTYYLYNIMFFKMAGVVKVRPTGRIWFSSESVNYSIFKRQLSMLCLNSKQYCLSIVITFPHYMSSSFSFSSRGSQWSSEFRIDLSTFWIVKPYQLPLSI